MKEMIEDKYSNGDEFIARLRSIDSCRKEVLDKAQVLHAVHQLIIIDALSYSDDEPFMSSWAIYVGELLLSRGRRVSQEDLIDVCLEIVNELDNAIELALMIEDLWDASIFSKMKLLKKDVR